MNRILIILVLSLISLCANAQGGPPNPGDRPQSTPLGGGSAPIGSGTMLLLGFGLAYAAKKYHSGFYNANKD